jgi:c(7)-type cytochrome triheme protein
LTCQNCHPTIFPYRGEPIGMQAVNDGEACGQCHGKVSFPASECERCHVELGMPEGRLSPELLGDLVFTRDTSRASSSGPFPPARFSHWVHRIRYRCTACHPDTFEARAGATKMTMSEMQDGALCGSCHNGRVAFELMECSRCHYTVAATEDSVP